ncbi:MAG TPA: hypothetical protein VF618_04035 [Thermoanaerobaculia bacterium]
MLTLMQGVLGVSAVLSCAVACSAALTRHRRAGLVVTLSGILTLIFFASVPELPRQMPAVSLLAVAAGILLDGREEEEAGEGSHVSFDETATRRR